MTQTEAAVGSLRITGAASLGALNNSGYAAAAYGNTRPAEPIYTWVEVLGDGRVRAYAGKVEYGQNIRTGFTMEVAEELHVAVANVELVLGDTAQTPWDMGTHGSQSTMRVGLQLRQAAATAYRHLLDMAAGKLDLPVDDLTCEEGRIFSRTNSAHGVSYAELLAGQDIEHGVQVDVPLSEPETFQIMGETAQRLDAIGRVTGKTVYSTDIVLPGMVYAALLRPPGVGQKLISFDASRAESMPGVIAVVSDGDFVAVLGETDQAAERAVRFVRAQWDKSEAPTSWEIEQLLADTAHDWRTMQQEGNFEEAYAASELKLDTVYFTPFISNAPMEPKAAVAKYEDGELTVWAGTQRPFGTRTEIAAACGLPEDRIRVIAPDIGGGFGSKSYYPPAIEAARLAILSGRTVRVGLTRAEEMAWSVFRPAARMHIRSGFSRDGRINAWSFDGVHAGNERPQIGQRGSETLYDIPNIETRVSIGNSPVRVGSYRSLGAAVNHFGRESHIDEIAAACGMDPAEVRLLNMHHPRYRNVLTSVLKSFDWRWQKTASGSGLGLAIGLDAGTYIGMAVEIEMHDEAIKVKRVHAAIDCGLTVNPEGVVAQVEGAFMMGLGTTLYERIDLRNGRLVNTGFVRYQVPHIDDTPPEIHVEIVGDPHEASSGAGEGGIVPVAAAVANAVYHLTGDRRRSLPLGRGYEAV